jgi:chorismate mutase
MTSQPPPPADPLAELSACRSRIQNVDARLIALLAERVEIGRRTATLKRDAGLPLLDPRREAEVIRRAGELAREHGLDSEAVRQLFWQIIGLSRRAQETAS